MDIYAHRPCCPWFAHLGVRLAKPPQIAGACGLGARRAAADVRTAAAPTLRRPVQVSRGWPRVGGRARPAGARGCTSREQAGRRPRPAPSGLGPRAEPGGGAGPCLHIFFGLLLRRTRPMRPRLLPLRAKPQVRRTTKKLLIETRALETPRTPSKRSEPVRNRATNRKKRARNGFARTRPPRAARDPRVPIACGRPRVARGRAGTSPARRPRAGPGRRRRRPAARFLRFVAGAHPLRPFRAGSVRFEQ